MNVFLNKFMMYYEIHRMDREDCSVSYISRTLGINRRTVKKYLLMSEQDYEQHLISGTRRPKTLLPYEGFIKERLTLYPDTSAAQLFDWLKEHHADLPPVSSRTVFNFVASMREKYNIPRTKMLRDCGPVPELPYGLQVQVDFGQYNMRRSDGGTAKVFFLTMVLSRSRYKYVWFLDHPFTTEEAITAHEAGFAFFGGVAGEAVYDQDRLFLISENHGDLILTDAFRQYVRLRAFRLHFCRKADPQSKGKVENVIRYVKQNFLYNRTYYDPDTLQEEALGWLGRTANALTHEGTGKVPYSEWVTEQPFLVPYTPIAVTPVKAAYTVRKDNTICFKSNYYSLPLGTYQGRGSQVTLQVEGTQLVIWGEEGKLICKHTISAGKGQKIINNDHKRDKSGPISALIEEVAALLEEPDLGRQLLQRIRKDKPRYVRDQLLLLREIIQGADKEIVKQALEYALARQIVSATDFRALVAHYGKQKEQKDGQSNIRYLNPLGGKLPLAALTAPDKSNIDDYEQLLNGK
ncbi:IS21 family transposase [Anseongella ginsenosidimutans]|nr:IS21 family transposase [Anseongella ginsenosidimutans]